MMRSLLIFMLCVFIFAGCGTTDQTNSTFSQETSSTLVETSSKETSSTFSEETSSTLVETSSKETSSTPEQTAKITIDHAGNTLYDEVSFAEDGANYDLIFFTNTTVKNFTLLEMDESEVLKVVDPLWCIDELTPEKPVIVSTWLNDATISRGISYTDQSGEQHVFSIFLSMRDDSVSLVDFKEQTTKDESAPLDEFTEQETLTIDEAFEAYLKGEITATYDDWLFGVREVNIISHFDIGGDYALHDVTGDGVPELHLWFQGYRILMYQDGKLVTIYVAPTNGWHGPISILENNAMFVGHASTEWTYTYTTFNSDGSKNEIVFVLGEYPQDETLNIYEFEGTKVTKQEFDELTKEYFAAAEKEAKLDWIEWTDYTDSFFNAYLKGKIPAIDGSKETYVYQHTRIGDGREGIDDYAFYDVTGDGVPELHLKSMGYEILMCQKRELVTIYESGTNGQHGPIVLLENGAMLEEHTTFETRYTYTTFNADGTSNKTEFGLFEDPDNETNNYYWFGSFDNKVTEYEFDELTKDIFAAAEKKAELNWIEWTPQ